MKKEPKQENSKPKGSEERIQKTISSFSTTDSTAAIDIQILVDEDSGELLGNEDLYGDLVNYIQTALEDDSRSRPDRINEGKAILEKAYSLFNQAHHRMEGTFAHYAIDLGKTLNILKKLVEKGWEAWCAENLKFMSESNRQVYMRLADTPRIEKYASFGIERLLHILSVSRGSKSKNPIGDFLKEFKLDFDPRQEPKLLMVGFKSDVDAAIFVAKAKKHGVDVDPGGIKKLLEIGVKPDNQILRNLALVQKNGGDTNKYLETLHMNQGQEEEFLEPEKRIEGFNKLVVRLKATIHSIIDIPELLKSVDSETIDSLEAEIAALKAKIPKK